jgi:ABC-type xylose transport system permease subunit
MIEVVVFLFPQLVIAAAIMVGGLWLAQYLGRSTLVWAFNEGLPWPRRLAVVVRVIIVLAAVAVAADRLNFGRDVFLAAFILLVGGVVLAASLALGLGGREAVRRYFEERASRREGEGERSLWSHL